jgi:dTMP kinase
LTLGRFITVEGGEGVGKSTQCRHILELLQAFKIEAILTREPGGSDGADQLRELLVTGSEDRWDPMSETLLLFAARRDHQRRTITPALEAGVWVISDRFNDSTLAYQGFGHGIDLRFLKSLGKRVSGELRPDLTFMLDAPSTVGIARALGRGGIEDRYERLLGEFHEKAREGFLKIAKGEPDRCRIIDATKPVEAVRAEISAGIIERFNFEDRKSSAQSIQSLSS